MSDVTATPASSESDPEAGAPVILSAKGLTKSYKVGGTRLEVLRGVDIEVHEGEILAILGTSGCGKSTLLHVLGWLDSPDKGHIQFEGKDRGSIPGKERARLRNDVMGFVFQFYHLLPEFDALENTMMPAMIKHGPGAWRTQRRASRDRAKALLALVGLTERMEHKPRQLSGGERQRVAIARALMNEPRFLFCDEPTGNLDGKTAEDVRNLLWGLNEKQNQTMVIVTHDARLASQAHRVVRLKDGHIDEAGGAALVQEIDLD